MSSGLQPSSQKPFLRFACFSLCSLLCFSLRFSLCSSLRFSFISASPFSPPSSPQKTFLLLDELIPVSDKHPQESLLALTSLSDNRSYSDRSYLMPPLCYIPVPSDTYKPVPCSPVSYYRSTESGRENKKFETFCLSGFFACLVFLPVWFFLPSGFFVFSFSLFLFIYLLFNVFPHILFADSIRYFN